MKKSFVLSLAGLVTALCLATSANAAKGPVIYEKARAVPTKSGKNVRITVYTNHAKRVAVNVDDSNRMKATTFGKGCGELRCEKWKVYAVRTGDECYRLRVRAHRSKATAGAIITVCEPFRNGSV